MLVHLDCFLSNWKLPFLSVGLSGHDQVCVIQRHSCSQRQTRMLELLPKTSSWKSPWNAHNSQAPRWSLMQCFFFSRSYLWERTGRDPGEKQKSLSLTLWFAVTNLEPGTCESKTQTRFGALFSQPLMYPWAFTMFAIQSFVTIFVKLVKAFYKTLNF